MKCGLEVEFHIYRLTEPVHAVHAANAVHGTLSPAQDPQQADWPGPAPQVALLHPGFHMLSDAWFDQAEPALRIVQRTAQALGLPLTSLEVEMGPSQVEAVFEATDALRAADQMVLFRNAVRQALRREGYHATFMCRPPFPHIMSSGWHLHQSLVDAHTGHNAFMRAQAAPHTHPQAAAHTLSDLGTAWLAGLLAHARGMAALCVPTGNGFARFQAHALAPCAAVWGTDNRGAMLRVVGAAGDSATRIENRLGEPAANPYLYIASQVMAGLDGLTQTLSPPLASTTPYASQASERLPTDLNEALSALQTDAALCSGLGHAWVNYYTRIRQSEHQRRTQSPDPQAFDSREYFSRI
jgi:glutamine synthetase